MVLELGYNDSSVKPKKQWSNRFLLMAHSESRFQDCRVGTLPLPIFRCKQCLRLTLIRALLRTDNLLIKECQWKMGEGLREGNYE